MKGNFGFLLKLFFLLLIPCYASAAQVVPDTFSFLAEKVAPSVVNISVVQKLQKYGYKNTFPGRSPLEEFNEFFERFGITPPGFEEDDGEIPGAMAMGSGFIIDPSGYVVTNMHVIDGASEITVVLNDDTKYKADLVGSDSKTDLALLKMRATKNFPHLTFADSDKAKVGDWIIAIGNPLGLGGSISAGIISAKARDIQAGSFDDFIQTDAAINKGNSGGPMIDMDGNVVGINTAIASPTGYSIGIGFAIPSSMAKPVIEQLKTTGKVKRGWLGVVVHPVSEDIAKSVGLTEAKGAIVIEVQSDGPAAKYGIKPGDVILKVNAKSINTYRTLPKLIAGLDVGASAEIEILRNGAIQYIHLNVGESPSERLKDIKPLDGTPKAHIQEKLGIKLQELNAAMKEELAIDKNINGLLVNKVNKNSISHKVGIMRGDIIIQIDGHEIASIDAFNEIITKAQKEKKENVLVMLMRKGQKYYVGLNILR